MTLYSKEVVAAQPWLRCRVNNARCPGSVCCGYICERLKLEHSIEIRKQQPTQDWYDESDMTMQTLTHQRIIRSVSRTTDKN